MNNKALILTMFVITLMFVLAVYVISKLSENQRFLLEKAGANALVRLDEESKQVNKASKWLSIATVVKLFRWVF